MSRLRIFLSRLRGLFLKRNLEQELADEIQSHLEMQIEDYERQGMNPDEARYAALRKFGGVDQVKEKYRDRRGLPFVETFLRDLGYGARMLRRSPIVTTVAILSLALGIGANTAIFSVVDAVLLKTLPVEAPDPTGHLFIQAPGVEIEGVWTHCAVADDHAPDPRVGRGGIEPALGELQRPRHEPVIVPSEH